MFTNLVDFDSKYGHRNDPAGYAKAIEAFDRRLPELMGRWMAGVLFITGDHGCDPTTVSTDHTRERTPLLAAGLPDGPHEIGTRGSFGDLGQTIALSLGSRSRVSRARASRTASGWGGDRMHVAMRLSVGSRMRAVPAGTAPERAHDHHPEHAFTRGAGSR